MIDRFLQEGLRGKSEGTVRTYSYALKQYEAWLAGAGADLNTYARSDVQQYIDYLVSKRKSASTINKLWNAIKAYSKWSGKRETIDDISVVKVADPKKQAPQALEKNERNKLIREIDRSGSKRDIAILMTMLMTGLRVSELVSLDRLDVDLSDRKGMLVVRAGKGNKERILPLNVEARRSIQKYIEERTDTHPALFVSNRQQRISIRSVQHLMEKHGHNAHKMRHSFITGLVRAGEDISVIQSLSGHSSADMILRYSMPSIEDKQEAVERLFKD